MWRPVDGDGAVELERRNVQLIRIGADPTGQIGGQRLGHDTPGGVDHDPGTRTDQHVPEEVHRAGGSASDGDPRPSLRALDASGRPSTPGQGRLSPPRGGSVRTPAAPRRAPFGDPGAAAGPDAAV